MDTEVSAALRDLRDTFLAEMRQGFAGVHKRQDITNGRIGDAEREIARHDERLKNVQREVFNRRREDQDDEPEDENSGHHRRNGDRRITERDFKMIFGTLLAAGGLVTFVRTIGPVLVRLVTP